MSLDPNKTYLVWNGTKFPNSTSATFKAPAGSTIDWGDGTVETFDTASTTVNTHTYTDGKTEHTIAISGLTSIGSSVFRNCSNLTSVTIGNSVTSIGYEAFHNCSSLTSITIPNSVTSIGDYAFYGCYKLIEVKNLSTLGITAGSSSYGYVGYYAKRVYKEGASYLSTIDNGYIIYDDGTDKILMGYTGTETDLTLPSGITQIYKYAFSGCSSLTSITIPNSVISIGSSAFSGCSSLTSITIPNSVTSIGDGSFDACSSLIQLILFPSSPPTLGSYAIPNNVQSIYVQQSSKVAYQAATNWTAFTSKIVSDNIYLSFVRFNQKNKEYIKEKVDGKLTAPTTPTADSVVTMAANGTVGTKPLSEFSGKLYNHRLYYMNASIGIAYIDIINSSDTAFTQPSEFISFIDNKVATVIGSNAIGTAVVRFFKDDIIWLRGCGINPSDTTVSATIDMQLSTTHFVSDTVTEL